MAYSIDIATIGANLPVPPVEPPAATLASAGRGEAQSSSEQASADTIGEVVTSGTQDGLTVTYDPTDRSIDFVNTDKGSVAVAAHEAEVDPHPQYETAAEVAAQIATHAAASDPHGDRAFASAADAAHVAAVDPHPQYHTAAEVAADIATHAAASDPHGDRAYSVQRSNHTGTQTASTISDFSEAVDDRVASLLVAGTNVTLTYNDGANTLTIAAAGGTPAGSNTEVQFNNSGSFGADSQFKYNTTYKSLVIGSHTGSANGTAAVDLSGGALQSSASTDLMLMAGIYYDGTDFRHKTTGVAGSLFNMAGGVYSWYRNESGTAGNVASLTSLMQLDSSLGLVPVSSIPLGRASNRWTTIYGGAGDFSGNVTAANLSSGTWTPTAFGATTAGTTVYAVQEGNWQRVGNTVTLSMYLNVTSMTGTGGILIGGLPFPVRNTGGSYPGCGTWSRNASSALTALAVANTTTLALYQPNSTQAPCENTYEIGLTIMIPI